MTKAEAFAKEFQALIVKHGAIPREYDEYDGQEEYTKTCYELKFSDYSTIDDTEIIEAMRGLDPFRP